MKGKRNRLTLGTVTFGEREAHVAFTEALSPYFAKVEVWPQQEDGKSSKRNESKPARNERR